MGRWSWRLFSAGAGIVVAAALTLGAGAVWRRCTADPPPEPCRSGVAYADHNHYVTCPPDARMETHGDQIVCTCPTQDGHAP